tara:strand:- start:247 stop:492 length:246 start_codon:yes stop_codon:yes gene_type:complete
MKVFDISMTLTRAQNDGEFTNLAKVQSEIRSWLEDLEFNVEFKNPTNFDDTYNEKVKDILWDYVSDKDLAEIDERIKNEVI